MSNLVPFEGDFQDQSHRGCSPFDVIRHVDQDEGGEFEWWSAREAMPYLGYERWENLQNAIKKAMAACRNSGRQVRDHFREITKTPAQGGPPKRDVQMTRIGMYLLAMNGDPDKPEIAAAQNYFTIQTFRAEVYLPPVAPPAPEPAYLSRPWSERLSETIQQHRLYVVKRFSPGSFTTYIATVTELLMIEDELLRHQIPVGYGDLPDGSIGRRWSDYRKTQRWREPIGQAPLEMPHLGIEVSPFVYAADLRPRFDEWLNSIYIPESMPDYFSKKKEWKSLRLSAASAAEHASLRLTGRPAELADRERRALQAAGGFVPARQLPPE